jgi:hypothetical protein
VVKTFASVLPNFSKLPCAKPPKCERRANAAISIRNKVIGTVRSVVANALGIFSASALNAGQYEVRAEITGFRTVVRDAAVTVGNTTAADMAMSFGDSKSDYL